ncbi:MAG: hypothetical protein JXA54_10425 [Candidatus Heimdallarchaeota archaeon]|nr:hypothetical protein [Candidatus Heimdallarchaeota archaeon]
MKIRKFTAVLIISFSISLFLYFNFGANSIPNVISYKGNKPVIIFDVGHQQVFNHTHLQSALQLIEDEFQAQIVINYDNFTLMNIRGADLLILPAPFLYSEDTGDGTGPYSKVEQRAVFEFYTDGGSVLYLANPYFFEEEQRNYTSNLNEINYLMSGSTVGSQESDYASLAFNHNPVTLMNDLSHEFNDERFIYLNNETLDSDHPIIAGYYDAEPVNELLIYSAYITKENFVTNKIINTTSTTYYVDSDGKVSIGGTRSYCVMAAQEKANSRGIASASAIMFSDLKITEDNDSTWWEMYDNALLWKNMIAWLLNDIPKPTPITYIPDFALFTISIIGVFFLLMVFGSLFFTIGKDAKKAEVSEVIIRMRERDERHKKDEKEIESAYYAEEVVEEEIERESKIAKDEPKELDMKSISDEVRKKPPKTRSRSERRRGV